jgi:hypothetical protein
VKISDFFGAVGAFIGGLGRAALTKADFLEDLASAAPRTIRLHVNRAEMRKGARGKPWTLHTSARCVPAKEVQIRSSKCVTEYRPEKKANPKAFVT